MSAENNEFAILGGGCFWCMEAVFKREKGIRAVTSGYAGGHTENPTYEEVCTGRTGHAEVVKVEFDPQIISFEGVLRRFFTAHDPTTIDRQGADVGTQYRSAILYRDEQQKATAERIVKELGDSYENPIVTEVVPLSRFYPAEEYHQDYFDKNPTAGYCRVVIAPKLSKLGMPKAPLE